MKKVITILVAISFSFTLYAQQSKVFHVKSPDSKIDITIEAGAALRWSVKHEGDLIVAPSIISLTLDNGEVLGRKSSLSDFIIHSGSN